MSQEERILINHVVSKLFGQLRKQPISEDERNVIVQKALQSTAKREKLKKLSEVPIEQLDTESRDWLLCVLSNKR